MKLFSYRTENIKFNAHPDGGLEYERSAKNVAIETPKARSVIKNLCKLVAYVAAKIYRVISSKFSS